MLKVFLDFLSGADITDYFNYGFNEDSWKQYCSKQNRLRAENGLSVPKFVSNRALDKREHLVIVKDNFC